ncbi:hypothetical protein OEA41_004519 [Lepraria neglecta]|uniref:Mitochondrial transcription factor 1 n=1 Tax=Lepraria neglecta TaxID=209136 RepID=A0AAE0DIB1_9LECA|nr:hypothetical protein OEA41_004519 [Lepraria neglecta]
MPPQFARHPLSKQLAKVFPSLKKPRIEVVSPRLCDDAIQRLAPSLAQYVGCTIVDMNPGAGLWSSKLHDFLKPRRHVLVEPNQDYLPFLQPLLDAPGSRYKYKNWDGEKVRHPDAYVEEGLIPDVEEARREGSLVLMVANFAGQKARRMDTDVGSKAHIRAIDFTHSARHNRGFHAYGPTRLLMWMTDEEKRPLLPRTVGYRHKLAAYLEASFHVEEILGETANDTKVNREDALEIESRKRVAERMAKEGIVLPPDRQLDLKDVMYSLSQTSRSWHREFEELDEGLKSQRISQFVGQPPGPLVAVGRSGVKKKGTPGLTPEYNRWRLLRNVLMGENKQIDKANQYLRKQEEIDKLDLEAHRDGIDPKTQEELLGTLDAKTNVHGRRPPRLRNGPPLLMWDQRKAEPLIAQSDEFWPSKEGLALLDFQPKIPQPFPTNREQSTYFDMLATELMGVKGPNNIKLLNKIAPGAFEALVPKVSAFTDPRRGGRRDVESIRNRVLTPEQLYGLAMAWDKWLFKPQYLSDSMPQSNAQVIKIRRGARLKVE